MITNAQRELRKTRIGSSDAAAILGLDPYRSAADVFLEKTGRDPGFAGNEATKRGNHMEAAVLNYAEDTLGVKLKRDVMLTPEHLPELCANLDGFSPALIAPIEAKSTVIEEGWGEQGTDEVPKRVLVQVHHQMHVIGAECRVAYIPVVFPAFRRFDFRMYRVERDDTLAQIVADAGCDFINNFVKKDRPPEDFRPSINVLKRIKREPAKVVEIPDELVKAYVDAKAVASVACEHADAAQVSLLAALGDAEGGKYTGGQITYFETNRKGFTVEPSTFRQLRVKPAKGK